MLYEEWQKINGRIYPAWLHEDPMNPPEYLWYQEWWIGGGMEQGTGPAKEIRYVAWAPYTYPGGVIDGTRLMEGTQDSEWEAYDGL